MDKNPPVDKDMWKACIQISKMIYDRTNQFIPEADIAAIITKHVGQPKEGYVLVKKDLLNEAAQLLVSAPKDWVMVPREPTEAMLVEGASRGRDFMSETGSYPRTKAVYKAMLAASPPLAQEMEK